MTRIDVDLIDRRIEELRTVVDRTTANLVELESDMTRQLLETSTALSGATAAAWSDASRRHADLWRGQFALENLLAKISEERGSKRSPAQAVLVRLDELLEKPCIELPRSVRDGRPSLTEGPVPTIVVSVEDALAHMSADYDIVAGLVATVATVWGESTERLHGCAARVAELETRVQEQRMRAPRELQSIGRRVAELGATSRRDPLALDPDTLPGFESHVARLEAWFDDAVRERQERMADLAAADAHIGAAATALEAVREQLDRSGERVVVRPETWAAVEQLSEDLEAFQRDVEARQQLGGDHGTGGLGRRAESLRDEVARLAVTERGRLERRDELRGLLGAYLAKAQAIGLAENAELDGLHAAAQDALYAAPCDLEDAEERCACFQQAVRAGAVEAS